MPALNVSTTLGSHNLAGYLPMIVGFSCLRASMIHGPERMNFT